MDQTWQIRRLSLETIQKLRQAEQQANQKQQSAHQKKEDDLIATRQFFTKASNNARHFSGEMDEALKTGEALMQDLNLPIDLVTPISSTPPNSTDIDQMSRTMHNQVIEAQHLLKRLAETAEQLRIERKKWWKFW